ncbi:MAG: DUF1156 domain-containing protein [Candidatus Thorarchaeota archaeon]
MRKRFIEWNLPLVEISEASAREKSIRHGYPSTLHTWWARKPLASSRATVLASLIDLPDASGEREEIMLMIKKITPWEAVKNGNDGNIEKAQQIIKDHWDGTPPRILDPFAGGGSIPLEALRLGCKTYVSDYNPVAVLIEKATLEWPQKFGIQIPHPENKIGIDGEVKKVNLLSYMVKKWGKIILEQATKDIERFYPLEVDDSIPIAYVWIRTIPCQNPACGAEIPLVRQFWLAKKSRKKIAFEPIVNENEKKIEFRMVEGDMGTFDADNSTVSRANARCLVCGQVTGANLTRELASEGKMGQRMIAVVSHHPKRTGKNYRLATKQDTKVYRDAEDALQDKIQNWPWLDNPTPDEKMPPIGTYGVDAQRYTENQEWGELFNSRQKLALLTFTEKIRTAYDRIEEDYQAIGIEQYGLDVTEGTKAIVGYLALALDRLVDFGSRLCMMNPTGGRGVLHTFARPALRMAWTYAESNPFNPFGAGWPTACQKNETWITHASLSESLPAIVSQSSATSLPYPDDYFDAIITDPPYYDNVPFADISDFFYVWLKRAVGEFFQELFATPLTPKSQEAIAEPMRQDNPEEFFENMLSASFSEMCRVLKTNGVSTIVYAHKTTAGWETMLNSLVNAGFTVTASWPIHTEMRGRLRAVSSAALASSIYMVCRKMDREEVGFYSEIQPQIKERIETKLQQFWSEGISGGDFFISAIGPGMEIFSQYEKVEKLSGERVTTAELLGYIRSVSTDFIVRKLLEDGSSAKIGNESNFYLAYRWTYLDNTVEYDDARKLAGASGVSLEELWGPGGFVKKSGSKISVLGPRDRGDVDSIHNMIDVMHKCLLLWEKDKKDEIAELLAVTGFKEDPAFKQFCQAVAECLLNGNKEKQLLEGFLMGVDDYAKAEIKTRKDQTDLRLFGGR